MAFHTTNPMRNHLESQIEEIFQEVFDDDTLRLSSLDSRDSLQAWDSLGHVRLISALEDAFGLSFTLDEIENMTSVAQVVATVASKQ